MDKEAWWATVHGLAKSQTQLSMYVNIQWSITNRTHHALYPQDMFIILNWKFTLFDPLLTVSPTPKPYHRQPPNLFPISMSLAFFFLDSICKCICAVLVFLWVISLNTMASRSICVVTNGRIFFFFMADCISVCVYSWPLNSTGPPMHGIFTILSTTVLHHHHWLNLQVRNEGHTGSAGTKGRLLG